MASSSLSSSWRALVSRGKLSLTFPALRTSQASERQTKYFETLQHDQGKFKREEENLQYLWSPLPPLSPYSSPILEIRDSIMSAKGSEEAFTEHRFGSNLGFGGSSIGVKSSLHDFFSKNQVGNFKLGFPKQEDLSFLDHESEQIGSKLSVREVYLDLESLLQGFLNKIHGGNSKLERFTEEETVVCMPGVLGSENISMEADSVKRKRKKKMNKHKHRKLRRLARKSKK